MRTSTPSIVAYLILSLSLGSTGCGGGSGSSVNAAPALLAVAFVGAGATPVTGDTLRLFMSEPVALAAGAILDDADMSISGGGSLGAVAAAPVLLSPHVVEVTLGAGVALTPGTTTLDFGAGNDGVQDASGQFAVAGTARLVTKGDGDDPTVDSITLNGIQSLLNGGGSAGGTLQVAHTGFTVDLTYSDGSSAVSPAINVLRADVNVTVGGTSYAAGENLVPQLTATTSATSASYLVPAGVSFPQGNVTLTCYVADTTGRASAAGSFAFLVRNLTADVQPFETNVNASQVWYLRTDRDVEAYTVDLADLTTPVKITGGANSRSDLEDLFRVLGLNAASPIPNVIGSSDSNVVVLDQFKNKVLDALAVLFPGVNVSFTFSAPGTFPANTTFIPYNSFSFSQMCISGSADTFGSSGVLGLAIFDPHNALHEDDCTLDFNGSRLGVFLHTLVNNGFLSASSSQFWTDYKEFAPVQPGGVGGTASPIGATNDDLRLTGAMPDGRATLINNALNNLARFTAVVLAHECGHSMGLVPNGAMPTGLYGNDAVNFPGSQSGHINMPASLFPGNSFNVMTPAIAYLGSLNTQTEFNSLNLAYLLERAIYN